MNPKVEKGRVVYLCTFYESNCEVLIKDIDDFPTTVRRQHYSTK